MPGWSLPKHAVPHADGAAFADGATYQGETALAALAVAAAARATTIVVDMLSDVAAPEPGHLLTLDDGLHAIAAAEEIAPDRHALAIDPPLRRPGRAGARVVFDRPHGLFRLSGDSDLSLAIDLQLSAPLSLEFREALIR